MIDVKSKKVNGKRCVTLEAAALWLLTFAFLLAASSSAQDDPPDVAPPPLKAFSKAEHTKLDAVSDLKERTKLSIELMSARLTAAEAFAKRDDFDAMFTELGAFQGLVDDSIDFLNRRNNDSGKVLDNFKRLEIALRGFATRVETIRIELPVKYDDFVRKLMKFVRDARTRATDPLFGNTVVPNRKTEDEQ